MLQLTNFPFLKKKLHILFLCSWYPSKVLPTNGDFIQRHATAVSALHKVTVLHIVSDKNIEKSIIDIKIINGVKTCIGYVKHSKNPFVKYYRFLAIYKKLITAINKIDVVHLNVIYPFGVIALHLKWIQKIPFIISEHWTGYLFPQNKNIGFLEKFLSKTITKNASFVCPVSDFLENNMVQFGLKGNYKPIFNVIDTNLFKPALKKETIFTIIHISSMLDSHKNISGMLQVAKKLEEKIGNFTWKFIGGSSKKYKKLINKLSFKKATIQFINHVSQKELVTHIQQSHLLVSFSNYETFGITIIEAIACGVPVITTDTGIVCNAYLKKYYTITPFRDVNSLCNNIVKMKEKASFNSEEAHQFIEANFSNLLIAKQFSELYFLTLNKIS